MVLDLRSGVGATLPTLLGNDRDMPSAQTVQQASVHGRTVNLIRSPRFIISGLTVVNVDEGSRQNSSVTSEDGLAPRALLSVGAYVCLGSAVSCRYCLCVARENVCFALQCEKWPLGFGGVPTLMTITSADMEPLRAWRIQLFN